MSWNYRLVKHLDGTYGIHEVYYDDCDYPDGMTVEPVRLGSFDYDEEGEISPKLAMLDELHRIEADVIGRDIFIEPEEWGH